MKTIMRRAATGDIPRVLIVGSSKDAYTKRYLADISCKIGFVADVVDDFDSFERVINERQVPTWSKGYSAVIINAGSIRNVIAMEEDLHEGETTLREKLGSVPVIGYDTVDQNEVHADELFHWFAATQVLRGIVVDNSVEGEMREALSSVIETAVDQHLERMAGTATATKDPRTRYVNQNDLRVDVESFSPKKIAIMSPKVVRDKAKRKSRRPSIIGNLLKKTNEKSVSRHSRSRSHSPTSISRGSAHSLGNALSQNSRSLKSNDISNALASTLSKSRGPSRSSTLQRNSPEANNMKEALANHMRNGNGNPNGQNGNGGSLQQWEREVRYSGGGAPGTNQAQPNEPPLPRRSPNGNGQRSKANGRNGNRGSGMIHL